MVKCGSCRLEAEQFCRCTNVPLCLTHLQQHQAEPSSDHQFLPIGAYERRDSPDFLDGVQRRLEALEEKRTELQGFLGEVEVCISKFTEAVTKLEGQLATYKSEQVQKLQQVKADLSSQIEAAVTEAKATLCSEAPQLQYPLTAILRGAPSLKVFSYQLHLPEVSRSLDSLLSFTMHTEPSKPEDLVISPGLFVASQTCSYLTKYERSVLLGEGSFGKVYKAHMKGAPTVFRAVKEVQKSSGIVSAEQRTALIQEVDLLAQVDHPHVMKVYELFEDDFKFAIVSELITGGELFDFLCSMDLLSEASAAKAIGQILGALSYLHAKHIVHRDLKPENIMLEKTPQHISDISLKLIDFGLSAVLPHNRRLHEVTGTLQYMAPEVFSGHYDDKCDVWSVGVILYLMLIGELPFDGDSEDQVTVSILMNSPNYEHEQWSALSPEVLAFVKRLLVSNPAMRPSVAEALNDPWLLKFQQEDSNVAVNLDLGNLKKYRCDLKLKQGITQFVTAQLLSKEETAQASDIFNSFDANHDGWLSREELIVALSRKEAVAEAEVEVEQLMARVDLDKSGKIDYSEFISAWMAQEKKLNTDVLDRAFSSIDSDHSGKISVEELEALLGRKGKASKGLWTDLLKQADHNGDGVIDLEEFRKLMVDTL